MHFIDPLGSTVPALEQNVLTLRAIELVLALFYVEELKRKVIYLYTARVLVRSMMGPSPLAAASR
jgi:hypothetical protein